MYTADDNRYGTMEYKYCGNSGLKLPMVSLGLWHNFGNTGVYDNMKNMCFTAFDNGITHFDLANNYGPEQILDNIKIVGHTDFTEEELGLIENIVRED